MSTPPSDNDLCHQQECRQCYPSSDEDDEEHNVLCDCNLQDCRDCFPSSDENDEEHNVLCDCNLQDCRDCFPSSDENDEENKDECQCSRFACRDCFPSSDEDHEDGDMKGEPDKRTLEVHHHYHQPEVHYHYHQPTLSPTPAEYPMALPPPPAEYPTDDEYNPWTWREPKREKTVLSRKPAKSRTNPAKSHKSRTQ